MKSLVEHIVKGYLLKESLSSVVYHFTHITKLLNILYDNKFYLKSNRSASSEIKNKKPYYMCYTRQFNGNLGYANGKNVRIHLDGDLLNQRYSGKSVDFWYNIYNTASTKSLNSKTKNPGMVESEDRLFSNQPIIDDALKYIKRIDVLMNNATKTELENLKYLAEQRNIVDILYIYDNMNDFNNLHSEFSHTDLIIGQEYVPKKFDTEIQYNYITRLIQAMMALEQIPIFKIKNYSRNLFSILNIEGIDEQQLFEPNALNYDANDTETIKSIIKSSNRFTNNITRIICNKIIVYVFNKLNITNLEDIDRYRKIQLNNWSDNDIDKIKTVKLFTITTIWNEMDYVFLHPENIPFWSLECIENKRKNFINNLPIFLHRNDDTEQAKLVRYINRLAKDNQISISQMIEICNKFNNSKYYNKQDNIFTLIFNISVGIKSFTYDDLRYNDVEFINENEKLEILKQFVI